MAGKRRTAKAGAKAGKAALRANKGQSRLARGATSSRGGGGSRLLKYGFFALLGLAVGAAIARSRGDGTSSSFTGTTGHHSPDAGSPAGQRGQTWGSGTPVGSAGGAGGGASDPGAPKDPGAPNQTGAERGFSDPGSGPLIGGQHSGQAGEVPVQHEEVENRIRTRIGEDPRTMDMPHVNVEVNDNIAELRGVAPSEEAKQAAGEIAQETEGVSEVRNLITVS